MSVKRRGKNWQATVRGPDGKEATKTFPKRVQADQWETRMKSDRLRGSWVDPQAGAIKLADWVALYNERATYRRATTMARTTPYSTIGSSRPLATGPCLRSLRTTSKASSPRWRMPDLHPVPFVRTSGSFVPCSMQPSSTTKPL